MTLVIMAAGMGSRFGGLKQIEPIDEYGNFIIDYSIYDAIKVGFDKIVFIIKKENYDIFRDTVGKRVEKHINVEYVFQELENLPEGYSVPEDRVKPWGTGHAILCAKDVVDENFAIINSDDFYGRDAFRVIANFLKSNKDESKYAMAGYKVCNTVTENGSVKRGVCEVKDNYLSKLVECVIENTDNGFLATPLEGGEPFLVEDNDVVSMNMFAFTSKLFEYLEEEFSNFLDKNKDDLLKCEFLIPSVVFKKIEEGLISVEVLKTDAVWEGITYKEDKDRVVAEIKALVDNGEYPEGVWE